MSRNQHQLRDGQYVDRLFPLCEGLLEKFKITICLESVLLGNVKIILSLNIFTLGESAQVVTGKNCE